MAEKLAELKEKLSAMGVSTNTPGLRGKERLEELRNRLEDALMNNDEYMGSPRESRGPSAGTHFDREEVRSIARVVEGLSSAQIRENLIMLGQVSHHLSDILYILLIIFTFLQYRTPILLECQAKSVEKSLRGD